jgi:hypothetical protein
MKAPKDLIREYETPEGGKVREIGPFVYGYSMTIGPDGKPRVKEFGNVKSPLSGGRGYMSPMISSEREPLSDVSITDKEVKVVIEMPGVPKDKIKLQNNDDTENPKFGYFDASSGADNVLYADSGFRDLKEVVTAEVIMGLTNI